MSEWISIKDRLPDTSEPILCYQYIKSFDTEEYFVGWLNGNEFVDIECNTKHFVTHWLPLPKPPPTEDMENSDYKMTRKLMWINEEYGYIAFEYFLNGQHIQYEYLKYEMCNNDKEIPFKKKILSLLRLLRLHRLFLLNVKLPASMIKFTMS